jgi:hypothetical protein
MTKPTRDVMQETAPCRPACGGPPASSDDHDDRTCPLTRTPGLIQRGRFAPRRKRPDFVDVPLDEDGPWDTGGSLFMSTAGRSGHDP